MYCGNKSWNVQKNVGEPQEIKTLYYKVMYWKVLVRPRLRGLVGAQGIRTLLRGHTLGISALNGFCCNKSRHSAEGEALARHGLSFRYSLRDGWNFFPGVGYSPALMGYMLPSGTSSGAGGGGWSARTGEQPTGRNGRERQDSYRHTGPIVGTGPLFRRLGILPAFFRYYQGFSWHSRNP